MTPLPILVINRAPDSVRLARFAHSAAKLGLEFSRIDAVDGHGPAAALGAYAEYLPDRFNGGERIKPGAFACALSHARAWEQLIESGARAALICEDDVELLAAPPRPPAYCDVLFCGGRMVVWRGAPGPAEPVSVALARMSARDAAPGDPGLSAAPGAEAYVVTATAARRLLALLARDKVRAGIDWLMLGWATPRAARPNWPELIDLPEGPLRALVSGSATARCAPAASAIKHSVTIPIAALRARA